MRSHITGAGNSSDASGRRQDRPTSGWFATSGHAETASSSIAWRTASPCPTGVSFINLSAAARAAKPAARRGPSLRQTLDAVTAPKDLGACGRTRGEPGPPDSGQRPVGSSHARSVPSAVASRVIASRVAWSRDHVRVKGHVGEQFHQPRPREGKRNTVVEGVRQFVNDQHVGERRQAAGACPVDLIECLGCCGGVACHVHGTVLRVFLPRGWDHPVASDGTTRRVVPGVLIAPVFGFLQVNGLGGSGDGVPGGSGDGDS